MAAASGLALGDKVAQGAWQVAAEALAGSGSALEIVLFDREGALVGRAPFAPVHDAPPPRKRRT
jgi:cobalt-precorrin-5B (C1)-methyltransferase